MANQTQVEEKPSDQLLTDLSHAMAEQQDDLKRKTTELTQLQKMWRTLKSESGYRITTDSMGRQNMTLLDLMEDIENRVERQ